MILAIIPAQGTSRRLSGKNMREVGGRPLLYWAVEAARNAKKIGHIIISTDDPAIAEYATSLGVQCMSRGKDLCGDVPVMDVYKDVVLKSGLEGVTHIVALQPDHPDRDTDIDAAIEIVLKNGMLDFITTDRFGVRHGSVRIMDCDAMLRDQLYQSTGGAWIDNCINIHTERDLHRAQASFLRKSSAMIIGSKKISYSGPSLIFTGVTGGKDTNQGHLKKISRHIKDAGADGVIFRESLTHQYDMGDIKRLFKYSRETGLIPLFSSFIDKSRTFFEELSNEAVFITCDRLHDSAIIKKAGDYNKPVIFQVEDTSHDNIRIAIDALFVTANRDIILLKSLNTEKNIERIGALKEIAELRDAFPEAAIGFSAQTGEINEAMLGAALALGARVIEFPYPCGSLSGPDLPAEFEGSESLKKQIRDIRKTERALGFQHV